VVVTGYRAADLQELLARQPGLEPLALRFVHNPDWERSNGLSVLAARDAVGERPFFLSMADHVYSSDVLRVLKLARPAPGQLALAADLRLDQVSDPDDAMWVKLDRKGGITDIGKGMAERDAVDTGVFAATSGLFAALAAEREARGGDCALADGVRRMAAAGLAYAVDIGDAWWQDVDTLANLHEAERKIALAEGRFSQGGLPAGAER
jgi:1L-myo-inositol 1-phosphate cytidylyltransferase